MTERLVQGSPKSSRWRIISPVYLVRQRGVTNITRTGSPSETRPPLSRRLRELRGVLFGHAEALAEQLLTTPPSYETVGWEKALDDLGAHFGNVAEVLEEPALENAENDTRRLLADIRHEDPYVPRWAADSVLARCCYLACRLIEPEVVVETGVAYGVSSAFILKALKVNGRGTLHSVDLPPVRRQADMSWGVAVPDELRGRWRPYRGTSARVLPRLLQEVGTVDLFVHDSLHTYRNMCCEFDIVWPRLRNGGLLLADDVERNRAFGELQRERPALWRVVEDREVSPLQGKAAPVIFGIAMK
jgi:predicted O-methyltransferase YrrM